MKIEFDYENGTAAFPSAAAERVGRASDTAVRLLILLAANPAYAEDFNAYAEEIGKKLNRTRGELDIALSFWCGAGIAEIIEGTAQDDTPADDGQTANGGGGLLQAGEAVTAKQTDGSIKDAAASAAAGGRRSSKLMRAAGIPEYTSEELADMLEKNSGALSFVDESQRRIGRMLNPREVSILIGLRGYLELEDEYIHILLDYCSRIEKTSMRYVETLAFGMYDEGVTDSDALAARLAERESYGLLEGRFKAMIGARGRRLTAKETRFLNRWSVEMKYDFSMIEIAYEITVDTKHEYNPAYMNGILERWYASGITEPAQAEAERSKKKQGADFGGSFDTDEFFEAALRRSIETDK